VAALAGDGEHVLLCRRANEPGSGLWSFPAGFVDRGETPEEALIREVAEETGLEAEVSRLIGVYARSGDAVVLLAYDVRVRGDLRPGDDANDVQFFTFEALPDLAFARDHQIMRDWRET